MVNVHYSLHRIITGSVTISISLFLLFGIEINRPIHEKEPQIIKQSENVSKKVMVEYIGKYGNPTINSKWVTWRHKIFKYGEDYDEPPNHLASQLFPHLGLYSSHDLSLLRHHCATLYGIGVDSLILEWWGLNHTDEVENNEVAGYTDVTLNLLLDVASEFNIKVLVQIPTYQSRNNQSIYEDIKYLHSKYFSHPSYMQIDNKPAVIIYDPHTINDLYQAINELNLNDNISCYFIASVVEKYHIGTAYEDGFDSIFTYFASEASTWCSNISNWKIIKKDCKERGVNFIPTVGPGFNNLKIERWMRENIRNREAGNYYERMWKAAVKVNPSIIVINSFNHWFEGTQIEPALERPGFMFNDDLWAGPHSSSDAFLQLTKKWIDKFKGFT